MSQRQLIWTDIAQERRFDTYGEGDPAHPCYEVRVTHVRTGLVGFGRTDVCNATLAQVRSAAQEQLLEQLNALSIESYGGSAA